MTWDRGHVTIVSPSSDFVISAAQVKIFSVSRMQNFSNCIITSCFGYSLKYKTNFVIYIFRKSADSYFREFSACDLRGQGIRDGGQDGKTKYTKLLNLWPGFETDHAHITEIKYRV